MNINVNTAEKLDIPHILVVDDDPVLLGLTEQVIKHLGYRVTTVLGSHEAINKIKEHPDKFDMVLTDYTLPEMNGIELAETINKLLISIPIILYSGRVDLIDRKQISSAKIAGLARKPCSMDGLDTIIKKAVYGESHE